MRLLIDVGNSCVKWAYWQQGKFSKVASLVHQGKILTTLKKIPHKKTTDTILIASVLNAKTQKSIQRWFKQHWKITPYFAQAKAQQCGIKSAYYQPKRLGVDRWLAMIAAYRLAERQAVCVVDVGTAITMDIVNQQGQHLGGYIVPGLQLLKSSLLKNTQRVRFKTQILSNKKSWGRSTQEAVDQGTVMMAVSFIHAVYEKAIKQGLTDIELVITGGDGHLIRPYLEQPAAYIKDLVLQGLILSYQDDQDNLWMLEPL